MMQIYKTYWENPLLSDRTYLTCLCVIIDFVILNTSLPLISVSRDSFSLTSCVFVGLTLLANAIELLKFLIFVLVTHANPNKTLLVKCQIMMQIYYFKGRLLKCYNIMQIYFYKDLLVKCHIIVMQIILKVLFVSDIHDAV